MPQYQIRILKDDFYSASLIIDQIYINDHAAIAAASKMAGGRPLFEVWRDLECIYGLPSGSTKFAMAEPRSNSV